MVLDCVARVSQTGVSSLRKRHEAAVEAILRGKPVQRTGLGLRLQGRSAMRHPDPSTA